MKWKLRTNDFNNLTTIEWNHNPILPSMYVLIVTTVQTTECQADSGVYT